MELLLTVVSMAFAIISTVFSIIGYRKTKKDFSRIAKSVNLSVQMNNEGIGREFLTDFENNIGHNGLKEAACYVIKYFHGICADNHYVVKIYKTVDTEKIKLIYSSEQGETNQLFILKNNTSFYEVNSTNKPYFINDIGYFIKQRKYQEKQFVTEDKDSLSQYQSIICFPIANNPIKGYLLIEAQQPLNDLIDMNLISEFLHKVCDKIKDSWTFKMPD